MNHSAELENLFALLNKEHNTTTYVILDYLTFLFILCSSIIILCSSIIFVIKIQNWLFLKSWMFYTGFLIKDMVPLIIFFRNLYSDSDDDLRFKIISYISINTFHIISALLYVPIATRMKKRKTISLKTNKPQRYIVWQTLLIMVFKIISLILAILLYFLEVVSMDTILRALYFFDATSTPLIVQISYLFNNEKSLKKLLLNFKLANFIRVLLNIEVKSVVNPDADQITMVQKAGSSGAVETGKSVAVIGVPGSSGERVEDRKNCQ